MYTIREEMLIDYLNENTDTLVEQVYVEDSCNGVLTVSVTRKHGFTYSDTIDMSFVMAWIWSKMK